MSISIITITLLYIILTGLNKNQHNKPVTELEIWSLLPDLVGKSKAQWVSIGYDCVATSIVVF